MASMAEFYSGVPRDHDDLNVWMEITGSAQTSIPSTFSIRRSVSTKS